VTISHVAFARIEQKTRSIWENRFDSADSDVIHCHKCGIVSMEEEWSKLQNFMLDVTSPLDCLQGTLVCGTRC